MFKDGPSYNPEMEVKLRTIEDISAELLRGQPENKAKENTSEFNLFRSRLLGTISVRVWKQYPVEEGRDTLIERVEDLVWNYIAEHREKNDEVSPTESIRENTRFKIDGKQVAFDIFLERQIIDAKSRQIRLLAGEPKPVVPALEPTIPDAPMETPTPDLTEAPLSPVSATKTQINNLHQTFAKGNNVIGSIDPKSVTADLDPIPELPKVIKNAAVELPPQTNGALRDFGDGLDTPIPAALTDEKVVLSNTPSVEAPPSPNFDLAAPTEGEKVGEDNSVVASLSNIKEETVAEVAKSNIPDTAEEEVVVGENNPVAEPNVGVTTPVEPEIIAEQTVDDRENSIDSLPPWHQVPKPTALETDEDKWAAQRAEMTLLLEKITALDIPEPDILGDVDDISVPPQNETDETVVTTEQTDTIQTSATTESRNLLAELGEKVSKRFHEIVERIDSERKSKIGWAQEVYDTTTRTLSSERGKAIVKRGAIVAGLLVSMVASMQLFPRLDKHDQGQREVTPITEMHRGSPQADHFISDQEIPWNTKKGIEKDLENIAHSDKEYSVDRHSVIEDNDFIYPGSELSLRDILFRIDRLGKANFQKVQAGSPSKNTEEKYRATTDLLLSAKEQHPQAVKFKLKLENGRYHMDTVDWQEKVDVRETHSVDFLVIGGEFESIAAATRAADNGQSVALLYSGPLGGMSVKDGANMRFFDFVQEAPKTVSQKKLMNTLDMTGDRSWSVPADASQRIKHFLETEYAGRIQIFHTDSYNSLHLNSGEKDNIGGVTTGEGIRLDAKFTVDAEPAAAAAEKAGLNVEIETPNIGYGMVFDVDGISAKELSKFRSKAELNPDHILAMTGLTKAKIASIPLLMEKYTEVQKSLGLSTATPNDYMSWGYTALGEGFDLYMLCKEFAEKNPEHKADLHKINGMRRMSGFNVSSIGNESTFNSISYQGFKKGIKQNDHSLMKDQEFKEIREIDIPALQEYLSSLAGKKLQVIPPRQLYVRQAASVYETKHKYTDSDFTSPKIKGGDDWMTYGVDLRAVEPRDRWDDTMYTAELFKQNELRNQRAKWKIRPETSETKYDNLGVVSYSVMPPKYVGALRIVQNLIGTSEGLVDLYVAKKDKSSREKIASAADKVFENANRVGVPPKKV